MERPYVLKHWRFTAYVALAPTLAFIALYLPFSSAALVWPCEWVIVIDWCLLGAFLLLIRRKWANHGLSEGHTLSIRRCTDLNLSPLGRLLALYLERAGIDANRRTLPPEKEPVRSNLFPSRTFSRGIIS